jgi:hypothetical protein
MLQRSCVRLAAGGTRPILSGMFALWVVSTQLKAFQAV